MSKVIIHTRKFDTNIQEKLTEECRILGSVWRDFEKHPVINREIDIGLQMAKQTIPPMLHEHIEIDIDPLAYTLDFFLEVGQKEEE